MRRILSWWVAAIGVLAWWGAWPAASQAGVWVTLAAGLPGSSTPTSESEFWFDTPHAPPLVAVNHLTGGAAQATTGGGTVFFGGAGTPVLLNLGDGSAYIASENAPSGATSRGPHGGSAGTPASAAPMTGESIPSSAALLGIDLAAPDATGVRSLLVNAIGSSNIVLGTTTVTVPDSGWWVIGLTPGDQTPNDPTPPPTDPGGTPGTPPPPTGGGTDQPPPSDPPPGGGDGPVSTPEPSTIVLVGIGGIALRMSGRSRARWKSS